MDRPSHCCRSVSVSERAYSSMREREDAQKERIEGVDQRGGRRRKRSEMRVGVRYEKRVDK